MYDPPNYLNLKDRLVQVWFNKYTIIILAILIKIYLFKLALDNSIDDIHDYFTQIVAQMAQLNNELLNLPHYYSKFVNRFVINNINSMKLQWITFITLMVTMFLNIAVFVMQLFLGTFICLFTELIEGFISFGFDLVNNVLNMIDSIIKALTTMIATSLAGIGSFIDDISSGINLVVGYFLDDKDIIDTKLWLQNINGSIAALNNVSLPLLVFEDLNLLESKVPDFDSLELPSVDLITKPLKKFLVTINESTGFSQPLQISHLQPIPLVANGTGLNETGNNRTYGVNGTSYITNGTNGTIYGPITFVNSTLNTTLPNSLSNTLSNGTIRSNTATTATDQYFQSLHNTINSSFKIILIVLIILAVLIIAFTAFKEYTHWKRKYELYVNLNNLNLNQQSEFTILNILNIYHNKVLYYFNKWTNRNGGYKNKYNIYWLFSYVGSKHSKDLLTISLAGFFMVLLQFILLSGLKRGLADNNGVMELNQRAGAQLSKSVNQSTDIFIFNTNQFITTQQSQLNEELFGNIKSISQEFSDSIDTFVADLNKTVVEPFASTPFGPSVNSIVYCVVTRKLLMISNGLNWVQDHLSISLPLLSKALMADLYEQYSGENNSATSQTARLGDDLARYTNQIIDSYTNSLMIELYFVVAIFGIWVVQLIMGLFIWWWFKRDFTISSPKPLRLREKLDYGIPFNDLK